MRAGLPRPGPRGRLRPRRAAGRRPLRQDGPQRHRVRPDAGLRRRVRDHVRGPRVRPRPPRDRRHLALRVGGALLAPRPGRAGPAPRVGVRQDRGRGGRLRRGSLDGRGGHRPGGVGPGHLLGPVRPVRLPEEGRLRPPAGVGPAQPVRWPRLHHGRRHPGRGRRGRPHEPRPRIHRRVDRRRTGPGLGHPQRRRGEKRSLPPVLSKAPPVAMVIFGASGDLTVARSCRPWPAWPTAGVLDDGFTVIGVARTAWSNEEFRAPRGRVDPGRRPQVEGAHRAVQVHHRRVRPPRHLRPC